MSQTSPIPVILDTDLGTDIDDHWALAMLLASPELDVKLITVSSGDTHYRAQLAAGILTAAGRTDIPLGIGPATVLARGFPTTIIPRSAAEMSLEAYEGSVSADGTGALIDVIMASPQPMVVITIGPASTVAAALEREPRIAKNARIIAMAGYIRNQVPGQPLPPSIEYNIMTDVPAFARLLEAEWEVTLAPVDTCATIVLNGARYWGLRDSTDPVLELTVRHYREWVPNIIEALSEAGLSFDPDEETSILWDTLAVYLAYGEDFVDLEDIHVTIDDAGLLHEDPAGRPVRAALSWNDRENYLDHLTARLHSGVFGEGLGDLSAQDSIPG